MQFLDKVLYSVLADGLLAFAGAVGLVSALAGVTSGWHAVRFARFKGGPSYLLLADAILLLGVLAVIAAGYVFPLLGFLSESSPAVAGLLSLALGSGILVPTLWCVLSLVRATRGPDGARGELKWLIGMLIMVGSTLSLAVFVGPRLSPELVERWIFVVGLCVLVPTLWCVVSLVRAARRPDGTGGYLKWLAWMLIMAGSALILGGLVGPHLASVGEEYDTAAAVGVDLRTLPSRRGGIVKYFAQQIQNGKTTRTEAAEILRYARARYQCEKPPVPRSPSSSAHVPENVRYWDQYVFFYENVDAWPVVSVWSDAQEVVVEVYTYGFLDYRWVNLPCERLR